MFAHRYRVCLAKQDFKFSSAHFTVFGPDDAEPLHGHNYRVEVELAGDELDRQGLLFDFELVKKAIRARCAALDSRTLLPRSNPHVRLVESDREIEAFYADRRYRLPVAECVVLELANVTIEELALAFWRWLVEDLELMSGARRHGLERLVELAVRVEETDGQTCVYSAPLGGSESVG